ncbi:FMN-binding glutamate synthase family protein [Caldicoprobacter faecalis]|uniref:Glutamate synthase conserved region-containing protein n=1 Tax=Caldicoprobacter faecalis TaxID=937334 RepID=A0A1I5XSS7_9FIRM|nr:FMN-binding glutamate synthase family protein [Caldicoprobacter faecalis]SFQ34979.1 glutamate synthase conserved region-containing protein [Caldicoprobacter faecalis]
MALMQYLYSRLVDQILEKMSDMKMVKVPWLVDNYSFLKFMGIAERAKNGQPLMQPLGSTLNFKDFQDLMFIPNMFPTPDGTEMDTQVVIGKNAKKPMILPVPFMIAGMAYGASISLQLKIALAKASASIGTATNSGEAGFLQKERDIAKLYVVQYNRAGWGNAPEELKQADMIEIKMGQGASAGDGFKIGNKLIGDEFRKHLKLKEGQDAVMPTRFPDINNRDDLKRKVDELRELTGGVPIAIKIAAGNIEQDLDTVLYAGADAVVIDGAQGETAGSAEITINNFGIPTLYALVRAVEYLEKNNCRDKISLIMTGGFRDSGDMLKAKALGADAFYIGYPVAIAAIYTQLNKLPAGASPTDLYLYNGKHTELLDIGEAAGCASNFLKALQEEMDIALRCLGKNSIHQLNKDDMVALTPEMAQITGVKLGYNVHPI